jgi:predicted NAD/FAD-binding protein
MKQGIDGWQDEDAVARTCLLTDLAIEPRRKDALVCILSWYQTLEKKSLTGKLSITLDFAIANAITGDRYGTVAVGTADTSA